MKPINYYVHHPSIDKIVEHYGARLEKLAQWQKFEVIGYLGLWASEVMAADDDEEIEWGNLPIDAEPDDEVALILGFCEAMNPQHIKDFIMAIADCIEVPSETAYYPPGTVFENAVFNI
jgi:hypothetical protein